MKLLILLKENNHEKISFNYSADDEVFTFGNDVNWNEMFVVENIENGFAIYPTSDFLDDLIATRHGAEKVDFALPDQSLNLFCLTISHKNTSKQYKIYFSLPQMRTTIILSEKSQCKISNQHILIARIQNISNQIT